MTLRFPTLSAPLRLAALAATLAAAGATQAAVGPPLNVGFGGSMTDIAYGNGGNVFQLEPMLFIQGLGSADNPQSVVTLNLALQYSFAVAGAGSGLMTIDFKVHNSSAVDSFSQLRFMLYTNPDGDSVDFADVLAETWGAAVAGDPVRREGRAFTNPADTLLARFPLSNNLTEVPTALDAVCLAAPGCDATVGMQWDAALLGPGETFHVRAGLSDKGEHLSSRWIDVTALNSPNTVLTLSGFSEITPVPEPSMAWMLAAGLAALGALARRRLPR